MRGRKPKPTTLKRLAGNPGKRPLRDPVKAALGIGSPPSSLPKAAKTIWRKLAKQLDEMELLARIDAGAFTVYCQALSEMHEANQHLETEGYFVKSPNGHMIQNPWLAIRKNAVKDIAKFAPEFGLSPVSRERLHVTPDPSARRKGNPFAATAASAHIGTGD